MKSRKPEARSFRRWITHEVIPSIRKTGSYALDGQIDVSKLRPEMQLFHHMFQAAAQLEMDLQETRKELGDVKETVQTIQETFLRRDEDWRESITSMMTKAAFQSQVPYQTLWSKSYEMLDERASAKVDRRLRNLKERLATEGATKTQINKANRLDVIEAEPRLKEIYTTIVKELSIGSAQAVSR